MAFSVRRVRRVYRVFDFKTLSTLNITNAINATNATNATNSINAKNAMKFRFIWIGKTKEKNWRALQDEYWSRLSHFVRLDLSEIRESAAHETKETEGARISDVLKTETFVVLLDVEGKSLSSQELAVQVEKWQNQSLKEIAFVIGGQDGVSEEITKRANFKLSLSRLTLTHETARVILLEQLYRAFTIIHNFPYQK